MTFQEKEEIKSEIMQELIRDGSIPKCGDGLILKQVRQEWYDCKTGHARMQLAFGKFTYYSVWELVRKLTCFVCGCSHVRDLTDTSFANKAASQITECLYNLRQEYKSINQKTNCELCRYKLGDKCGWHEGRYTIKGGYNCPDFTHIKTKSHNK